MRAVAPVVAERGAEAVLAMHGPVTIQTASRFTRVFYRRLYSHGEVDVAVSEARAAVKEAWDWSVPVLFMLHDDGRIIDFDVSSSGIDLYANANAILGKLPDPTSLARAPGNVISAMNELRDELAKSHEFLVELADSFRRTESGSQPFQVAFDKFRRDFETLYNRRTWVEQQTKCDRVGAEWDVVLPFFESMVKEGRFDHETFEKLDGTMRQLATADADCIDFMGQVLDTMHYEINEINTALESNDTSGAILRKRAYERRLSDSFRRSRKFLQIINRAFQLTIQKLAHSVPS